MEEQKQVWYSNNILEFYKYTPNEEEYSYNVKLLDSLSKIPNQIRKRFLAISKDSIMFLPLDIDSIKIKRLNSKQFIYESSLTLGQADKLFNEMLFNEFKDYLFRNEIDTARVITMTSRVYKNKQVPLPPGILTNFEYE
ncbi:hypothetical protein ACFO3O_17940 [Dokdonia ponticola]|uniref:Uncharacterized protein n=1 Tax=Dokdonia ponticola TaxID=2041041 RepID=A0ABV9I061_9FLAO